MLVTKDGTGRFEVFTDAMSFDPARHRFSMQTGAP
jgi:hypothetical protein